MIIKHFRLQSIFLCIILFGCGDEKKVTPQPEVSTIVKTPSPPQVEQSGDIQCRLFLDGTAPKMATISMNADRKCVTKHTKPMYFQSVLVNDKGMLQNVFVYVKSGLGSRTFSPPKDPVVIDQRGCMYEPHILGIQVNQLLLIVNSDPVLHNVHALPKINSGFNIAQPLQKMRSEKSFSQPEIMIRVKCEVHPWMGCYVGVLAHPFFNVSGSNGTCVLRGLPLGEYLIAAWHEKYGSLEQKVVIVEGTPTTIDFRFIGS